MASQCTRCGRATEKLHYYTKPLIGPHKAPNESLCVECVLSRFGIDEVPVNSEDVLNRRSDLSTFVVHLCRDHDGKDARERLKSILSETPPTIKASRASGIFANNFKLAGKTQAACFTEMPLEHIYSFSQLLKGRKYQFRRYGLVFSKPFALARGIGPIWYMNGFSDQPEGVISAINQLTNSLSDDQIEHFRKLAPFLEWWHGGRNFYWEREWRHSGDFTFSRGDVLLGICPDAEVNFWERDFPPIKFFDPADSLDSVIEKLAKHRD